MSAPRIIPDTPPALAFLPATAKSDDDDTPLDAKRPEIKKATSTAAAESMNNRNTFLTCILYLIDTRIIIHVSRPVAKLPGAEIPLIHSE